MSARRTASGVGRADIPPGPVALSRSDDPGPKRGGRSGGGLVLAGLAAFLSAVTIGAAATLGGLVPDQLGSGDAPVAACDSNGFTTSYTVSAGNVTAVTIGGIADPGCEGGSLSVTLTNGDASLGAGGPQTVPADAGTVDNSITVSLSPQPAASEVDGIHVAIVGP